LNKHRITNLDVFKEKQNHTTYTNDNNNSTSNTKYKSTFSRPNNENSEIPFQESSVSKGTNPNEYVDYLMSMDDKSRPIRTLEISDIKEEDIEDSRTVNNKDAEFNEEAGRVEENRGVKLYTNYVEEKDGVNQKHTEVIDSENIEDSQFNIHLLQVKGNNSVKKKGTIAKISNRGMVNISAKKVDESEEEEDEDEEEEDEEDEEDEDEEEEEESETVHITLSNNVTQSVNITFNLDELNVSGVKTITKITTREINPNRNLTANNSFKKDNSVNNTNQNTNKPETVKQSANKKSTLNKNITTQSVKPNMQKESTNTSNNIKEKDLDFSPTKPQEKNKKTALPKPKQQNKTTVSTQKPLADDKSSAGRSVKTKEAVLNNSGKNTRNGFEANIAKTNSNLQKENKNLDNSHLKSINDNVYNFNPDVSEISKTNLNENIKRDYENNDNISYSGYGGHINNSNNNIKVNDMDKRYILDKHQNDSNSKRQSLNLAVDQIKPNACQDNITNKRNDLSKNQLSFTNNDDDHIVNLTNNKLNTEVDLLISGNNPLETENDPNFNTNTFNDKLFSYINQLNTNDYNFAANNDKFNDNEHNNSNIYKQQSHGGHSHTNSGQNYSNPNNRLEPPYEVINQNIDKLYSYTNYKYNPSNVNPSETNHHHIISDNNNNNLPNSQHSANTQFTSNAMNDQYDPQKFTIQHLGSEEEFDITSGNRKVPTDYLSDEYNSTGTKGKPSQFKSNINKRNQSVPNEILNEEQKELDKWNKIIYKYKDRSWKNLGINNLQLLHETVFRNTSKYFINLEKVLHYGELFKLSKTVHVKETNYAFGAKFCTIGNNILSYYNSRESYSKHSKPTFTVDLSDIVEVNKLSNYFLNDEIVQQIKPMPSANGELYYFYIKIEKIFEDYNSAHNDKLNSSNQNNTRIRYSAINSYHDELRSNLEKSKRSVLLDSIYVLI
jgi:hypothetical protein